MPSRQSQNHWDQHRLRRLLEGDGSAASLALRAAGFVPGKVYGLAMAVRRRAYDAGWFASSHAGLPTLSVGNLTAGGSGKTPTVALLAGRLLELGHRPAVLMRGYGATAEGESDEAALYRELVPEAILAVNPDRRRGAEDAKKRGATVLLMDDGFQHRRLRRDLDIVLVDATSPWGGGNTIPGGLLREPKSALKAAGIVVLTRSDQVDGAARETILEQIRRLAPNALVTTARHRPVGLRRLDGTPEPLDSLAGRAAVALSAIARPEALVATLAELGATAAAVFAKPDHHPLDRAFVFQALERAAAAGALAVTTEKDAVKPVFQHLRREMTDNIDANVRAALSLVRILGVRQEIRDFPAVMEVLAKIAPIP